MDKAINFERKPYFFEARARLDGYGGEVTEDDVERCRAAIAYRELQTTMEPMVRALVKLYAMEPSAARYIVRADGSPALQPVERSEAFKSSEELVAQIRDAEARRLGLID